MDSSTSAQLPSFPQLCVPSASLSTLLSLLAGCLPHSFLTTRGGHNCQHWQGELLCQEVPAVASWCSVLQGCHHDAPHVPYPGPIQTGQMEGLLVLGG